MAAASTATTPISCVLIADQQVGRLFACRHRRGSNAIRLEEIASHANALISHDRGGRPTATKVRRVTFANPDRDHDIMRDQFAADLLAWLQNELRMRPTDGTLVIFAPPEFLGALRSAMSSKPLPVRITDQPLDLARLSTSELERHPSVIRELAGPQ
ncbi:MAG: host attachment protein [Phycisphaerales bacterium]|nr:host attachment protein [Phycisphaerales bacterium]